MNAKRTQKKTAGSEDANRFERISQNTADIVRTAAELLDEELASGIVAARRMQQRFAEERRIDPRDFRAAAQKLQSDAHGFIGLLETQLREMRSNENAELMQRLVGQSHGLIDLFFDLTSTAAEVANQLAQSTLEKSGVKRGDPDA